MKKILSLFTIILSSSIAFGQINIADLSDFPPNDPVDCSIFNDASVANFFDDGGAGADYLPGQNHTFTICPDLSASGPKIRASFWTDRKSTRLNSSHVRISYAVFCLKKKR